MAENIEGAVGRIHTFSYPEPFLRAVNGARQGALAKSISNWHLIGYNEGYCSNNVYILLPCFYGIRFWIWPEPLVAPRVRRALGTRMASILNYNSLFIVQWLDVSSSPFLLFLYARLTRNWLHFEQPSSYSRYIWSSLDSLPATVRVYMCYS